MRYRLQHIATVLVALLSTGCAAKKPPHPLAPVPASPASEGKTAYSFMFDGANPALNLPSDVRFNRPQPTAKLALPIYPESALAAGDGPHREIVRVIIDDHGRVASVADSPLGTSDASVHAADFRTAVESAVHLWQFNPGYLLKVAPGNDLDGDGKPDYIVTTSINAVPVYYDVKFTFEIVAGKGVVRKE